MRYTVRVQPGQLQAVTSGLRAAGISPVGTSLNFIFVDIPAEKVAVVGALPGVAKVTPQQTVGIAAMPVEAKLATFMAMAKKPGGLPGAVRWAQAQDAGVVRTPTSRAAEVMGATAARKMGLLGRGVKVAVLDTGIDVLCPQMPLIRAPSYVKGDPVGDDVNGHGSHVASTIGGSTRGSLRGLAPGVDILPIKVLGYGIGMGNDEDIINGMEAAYKWGADIISMSLGGVSSLPPEDDPMCVAVEELTKAGVIFSIAAGNSGAGDNTVGTPGAAPAAITVGALDETGVLADFSSRGPSWDRIKPDICGVGVNLGSSTTGLIALMQAKDGFKTGFISGTSMATPCVSAILALWIEYARAHGVSLTADMLKEIFARHGKEEKDSATGWGMLHFEWILKEI